MRGSRKAVRFVRDEANMLVAWGNSEARDERVVDCVDDRGFVRWAVLTANFDEGTRHVPSLVQ